MSETGKKSSKKQIIIATVVLVVLIAAAALIYVNFKPKAVEGAKTVSIEVIDNNSESEVYEVNTDAEFLRQAMEEADDLTFSGAESEYGMMVDTVNDVTADYNTDGAYWAFYVNGEYCNYGIDSQPVADGDEFQIVYTAE